MWGKTYFFFENTNFMKEKQTWFFYLEKKVRFLFEKIANLIFLLKNRKDFYLEKYRSDFINKI